MKQAPKTTNRAKKPIFLAFAQWKKVLGKHGINTDSTELAIAETATFATHQKVEVILLPKTSREVQQIMKIATKYKVAVYPVSGGKNWGLGSRVPQKNGVVMDLSRMNKILECNEPLAYLTVEPGVTFKQAETYLRELQLPLMLDTIGSTPEASIIGNTAERGHGMGLYADRLNHVCGLEIVLPDGEIMHTGFSAWNKSKLASLAKWGTGPALDGIFTQSNWGVITKLTLWLKPAPKHFQSFIFHIDSSESLEKLMNAWRKARLEGLQYSLRIFNDIRMLAFSGRFPEGEAMPISEATLARLRTERNIGKWIGLGATYPPSEAHAKADRDLIMEICKPYVTSIEFYTEQSVRTQWPTATDEAKAKMDFIFNRSLLRGFTSPAGINMVYWRKPATVAVTEIHRDGCGVLWYCPAIPFTGQDTLKAITIASKICNHYKLELNIGFLFISERALDITGAICYDRHKKGEDKRAKKCHDTIMREMQKEGYTAYRLGIPSMSLIKNRKPGTTRFLQKVKQAIDPDQVLAPGRYLP